MDWVKLGKWVLAAISAIAAIGLTIKLGISKKSSTKVSTRKITQKSNVAGGDIIGGDKIEHRRH